MAEASTSGTAGVSRVESCVVPLILQQQYNLLDRGSEMEAFQVCKDEGLGVLPWSPLKG